MSKIKTFSWLIFNQGLISIYRLSGNKTLHNTQPTKYSTVNLYQVNEMSIKSQAITYTVSKA